MSIKIECFLLNEKLKRTNDTSRHPLIFSMFSKSPKGPQLSVYSFIPTLGSGSLMKPSEQLALKIQDLISVSRKSNSNSWKCVAQ